MALMRFLPSTRRLGLRARLTLSFALGAALLSAILSITTWELTRENLLRQRAEAAQLRAIANAETVSKELGPTKVNYSNLIASLPTPEGAQPIVFDSLKVGHANNSLEFGP